MDYEKIRIVQSRGPVIEARAALIASDTFEVRRDGTSMTIEVWETQGGALLAVTRGGAMQGGEVREIVTATVADAPSEFLEVDEHNEAVQAQRFRIMDAFDWEDRARSMVRTQLKWRLKRRVA